MYEKLEKLFEKQWMMNPATGSVDTYENWECEIDRTEMQSLVPVIPGDDQSHWIQGYMFDAACLMDDEIRERLHNEMAPCEDEVFFRRYQHEHFEKYDEFLTV